MAATAMLLALAETRAQEEPRQRRELTAVKVSAPPVVDGEVLGDPVWSAAVKTSGFRQTAPDEGEPASERTEVAVVFTEETLYLGVVCYDRTPRGIVVSDTRRDAPLDEADSFQLILDTYLDELTGFVFGTNPAGRQFDGQVAREGEGAFGSGGAFNRQWDGVWEVKAKISDIGWSAEFAIPFATLRFPRGGEQVWGVNFQRNIRRRNENAYWSPLPRQFDLFRLSLAGRLIGLEAPSWRSLQITPYALTEGRREGTEGAERTTETDFGGDLKYRLTPSLTLDATYNTDFAHVEVDEQQINLDRFNLFFPEKRPFFLENAGLFAVGVPEEVELFFSRRIGIGPDGEEIPIEGGLRLTGKAGQQTNLGLLYMRTEAVDGVAPENDFAVARVSRDLPNRSLLGAILVNREGRGYPGSEDDYNRTIGVDGRWGIGELGLVQGFVARTDTPGADGDEYAFRLGGSYDSGEWRLSGNYTEVADDFNPEVGFLQRSGYRKPDLFIMRRVRPEDRWGLMEVRPHISYRGFWNFDGFQETGFLHIDNHLEWRNGYELHTGVNFTHEGLTEAFEIHPGVWVSEGTYDHSEIALVGYTNRGAPLSFSARVTVGGFFGGDRLAVSSTLRYRGGDTFSSEFSWHHNDIDLPAGAFDTDLGRLRLSYSFTPRIFLESLVQYNDVDDEWTANLRFGWLRVASSGLYVVYNERQDIGSSMTGPADRSLIVKYSYLFDVLK